MLEGPDPDAAADSVAGVAGLFTCIPITVAPVSKVIPKTSACFLLTRSRARRLMYALMIWLPIHSFETDQK